MICSWSDRKCLDVKRYIEDNLRGEYMTTIHALVSPEFFDALCSERSSMMIPL
ncbi:MAG: major capsid protein [Holosporales bacterium]|nr:major capsid protein [Holosporales bacterium]